MALHDNQKPANIVSPLHTQRRWEAIKHLKGAFFSPPRKYKYICFDLIFSKESYPIFMSVHNKKHSFQIYLSATSQPPRTNSTFTEAVYLVQKTLLLVLLHISWQICHLGN